MIEFKRGDPLTQPGTWQPSMRGSKATVLLSCPKCGGSHQAADHDIADDGTMSPSVLCPKPNCGFHDYVILAGWKQ